MLINTTNYLLSFKEFCQEIEQSQYNTDLAENFTQKDHIGGSDVLYQCQHGFHAVQYLQTREWRVHFNGSIGNGSTLSEAELDLAVKCREAYEACQ